MPLQYGKHFFIKPEETMPRGLTDQMEPMQVPQVAELKEALRRADQNAAEWKLRAAVQTEAREKAEAEVANWKIIADTYETGEAVAKERAEKAEAEVAVWAERVRRLQQVYDEKCAEAKRPRDALAFVITPEMMEAGLEVLEVSGRLAEGPLGSDGLLAAEVFRAMLAALAHKGGS
jgi:hypothetical protein